MDQFLDVFKEYNQTIYPIQVILLLLAVVGLFLAIKPRSKSDKLVSGLLAFLWIWMGVVYHLIFFTEVNYGAYVFGIGFLVQGFLFIFYGLHKNQLSFNFQSNLSGIVGIFLIGYALIIYPVLGYMLGHNYPLNPTFGLPCPTTIFTFGILLLSTQKLPLKILIIPLFWSIIGFQAAISFAFYEDIGLFIAGIVSVCLLIFNNRHIDKTKDFKDLVKNLFSESKNIGDHQFSFTQISTLPSPVQRYFRLVLKEGQSYISYVRLLHDGSFKTSLKKKWTAIKGEQYFSASNPGFIWRGTTSLFTARDMFINGSGSLVVSILSLFRVINGSGTKFNHSELLRWLAESVWFPTNLLPTEKLRWIEIDELTAKLTFTHNELQLSYIVTFNTNGEITHLETKRYMDEAHLETWIGKMSDYKQINGVVIPTTIEAVWSLADKDFSYAKFYVKKIEYDNPQAWPDSYV